MFQMLFKLTRLVSFTGLSLTIAVSTWAAPEGYQQLHPIASTDSKWTAGFTQIPNCGGVVIDSERKLLLTAWHCVQELFKDSFKEHNVQVGYGVSVALCSSQISAATYDHLKLVATGACIPWININRLQQLKEDQFDQAVAYATRDWAIVESDQPWADDCKPFSESWLENDKIVALGWPGREVIDIIDPQNRAPFGVMSQGNVLDSEYQKRPEYTMGNSWSAGTIHYFANWLKKKSLILTSARIVSGMSGGPVVRENDGVALAVSTLDFSTRETPRDQALWGTHLAIPIAEILKQRPDLRPGFNCHR